MISIPTPMPTRSTRRPGRYDLENSIGYLLNRAASLIAARFDDDLKAHDVTLQAWRILATLSQFERQSVSELADHTGAELSYLSRSASQLEQRGLIQREPSALDRRASLLSLTEAGWALVRELAPKGRAIERESISNVPAEELQAALRTLRAICHNLVPDPDLTVGINRKLTIARRVRQKARSQDVQDERVPRRAARTRP